MFRNKLINGNFDIWQRGTGVIGIGFLADRFNVYINSGTGMTQSRYSLTDAERAAVGWQTRYALAMTTNDSTSISALQPIEGVNTFSEQTVTLSFWAWSSSGTNTISANLTQSFGTGGSPSVSVATNLTLSNTLVGTTPIKITATITLPSIAGKTLGTNNNDYLGLNIQKVLGNNNSLRITQIQLEAGPVATPFEQRPIGTELALCQRYAKLLYVNMVTTGYVQDYPFADMRTTPGVSIISSTYTGGSFTPSNAYNGRQTSYSSVAGTAVFLLSAEL
jgi:hypothetical protein